ncbi:dihydrolipoyl dehydrogenase [Candidatus Izimaplasma bacterium ZiA1]|uniref:dihydrolipoyl dehydrogenase n=1 Tax=Candidatus Izimoplasma sp. ZiA1 TaxID=2024899 RepID=UPI000BAA6AF5|nr:dihydrolipoyl dehydrogenase [Candidatus Izimaplasma bacterium ZiA1]
MYDVIVLGAGPGGYVAAIKAAQSKLKVAIIEKEAVGGVCLNWGCIPTKAMLKTAKVYKQFMHSEDYGLEFINKSDIKIDLKKIKMRKDKVVAKLTGGVKMLLKKNGVEIFNGFGTVVDKNTITVNDQTIKTKNIILATGSHPFLPPIKGLKESFENGYILTAKEILALDVLPKELTIIGGGVIGIEFATLYSTLGTKVTVIERSNNILMQIDHEVRNAYLKLLENENLSIKTSSEVTAIENNKVTYIYEGDSHTISADKILLSIGTKPNLKGLENLNLLTDKSGVITNLKLETNVENVYAIGDMNGKMMLAHVASAEGIIAVENILGENKEINYFRVPSGIYGFPEIAYVGLTEKQAIEQNKNFKISVFPLSANGKALAEGDSDGFIKIIADKEYGELLGMHILASNATDMIAEAVTTMELEGTVYELARAIHPHPTLSEIVVEAAHGVIDKPIHI